MKKTLLPAVLIALAGCSMNKIAVRQTAGIIDNGLNAFYRETDLQLARESMPANLKLMEVLLENDPENTVLLVNLSRGYCGYAFMFLDDSDDARASHFYEKGMGFSARALAAEGADSNGKIKAGKITKKCVPAAFWRAFCEFSWIYLNMKEPSAMARLPYAIPVAKKVEEIRPDYYYNGIYALLASYYAARPRLLGGDPEKAEEYFKKAVSGEGKNFLPNKYMYAKIYSVLLQDEELFEKLLDEIIEAPAGPAGAPPLVNTATKEKAKKLKEKKDELF